MGSIYCDKNSANANNDLPDGFYLSVFIQLNPHVLQLHLGSGLRLLQLCNQLLLQIQPQLLTALRREI